MRCLSKREKDLSSDSGYAAFIASQLWILEFEIARSEVRIGIVVDGCVVVRAISRAERSQAR